MNCKSQFSVNLTWIVLPIKSSQCLQALDTLNFDMLARRTNLLTEDTNTSEMKVSFYKVER